MSRSPFLKWILIISILSVVLLPAITILYLNPSFNKLLITFTEEQVRDDIKYVAKKLFAENRELNSDRITEDIKNEISRMKKNHSFLKVKIFSPDGTIIHSTAEQEIGKRNTKNYFQKIVSKGRIFSKTVKKGTVNMEGEVVPVDVVETYHPLMYGEHFLGAFEIYYDITDKKVALSLLTTKVSIIVFGIAVILFFAVVISIQKTHIAINKQTATEDELRIHKNQLEDLVNERTSELTRINKFLNDEIKERMSIEQALMVSKVKYQNLVELATDIIYTLDEDGRFVFMNEASFKILHITSVDIIGQPWREWIHPEDRDKSVKKYNDMLEMGVDVFDFENRFITKSGRTLYLIHNMRVLRDENGSFSGCQCIARDITVRKQMEEEFIRTRNMESIGVLAGGIAHDFNNLLTVILGNISLFEINLDTDSEMNLIIGYAKNAAMQAKDLTSELLTFSRGGAPVKITFSVDELLRESSGFLLRGSNIRLEFDISENLWSVDVDIAQISQVFNNLLINAREAMSEGGTVHIRARNAVIGDHGSLPVPAGQYIVISIEDEGKGIPEEHLSNIFDPYFTTKKMGAQKGVGLGLSICYSIIKSHDGAINVESKEGEGTKFHIYLPASEAGLITEDVKHDEPFIEPVKHGLILVMDDEEIVRKTIGFMLKRSGFSVDFAQDGDEAVKMYTSIIKTGEKYDAVILDLTIPGGMGGRETIKKMLDVDPEIRAIVSSGYFDDPVIADYQDYGFKGVLAKPFNFSELQNTINSVIE